MSGIDWPMMALAGTAAGIWGLLFWATFIKPIEPERKDIDEEDDLLD